MKKQQKKAISLRRRIVQGYLDQAGERWSYAIIPMLSGDGDVVLCKTIDEVAVALKGIEKKIEEARNAA